MAVDNIGPSLLSIPAELRNVIYTCAIVDAEPTEITDALRFPPLLQTCRQLRKEAFGIYLTKNNFFFEVRDCDGSILIAFNKHIRASTDIGSDLNMGFRTTDSGANWTNVMSWCKANFVGDCHYYSIKEDGDRFVRNPSSVHTVVGGAFELVQAQKDQEATWEQCTRILKIHRHVAAKMDDRWLRCADFGTCTGCTHGLDGYPFGPVSYTCY